MADDYTPTVVQPAIDSSEMSAIEVLLLSRMFEYEMHDGAVSFFARDAVCELPEFPRAKLHTALALSSHRAGRVAEWVRQQLDADPSDPITLDLSGSFSWEDIFQDVIRRCPSIGQIVATSAFTCSKMRSDGFGGMVVLITAEAVFAKTTHTVLLDLLVEAKRTAPDAARGEAVHVLLTLDARRVRDALQDILAGDPAKAVDVAVVPDAAIRLGCASIGEQFDFTELRHHAEVAGALAVLSALPATPAA